MQKADRNICQSIAELNQECFIAIGGKNQSWIIYPEADIPLYVAKSTDSFIDSSVAEKLREIYHRGIPHCYGKVFLPAIGEVCYIFDYIEGVCLNEKKSGISNDNLILIFIKLFELLVYLQNMFEKEIWHLDIKPENIVIRENEPVLIDFGAAFFSKTSEHKEILGEVDNSYTPAYAAPELLCNKPNSRSDVYSLGLTLACKLSVLDVELFKEKTAEEITKLFPDSISDLILKCLNSDSSSRPQPDEAAFLLRKYFANKEEQLSDQIANHKNQVICVWQSAELACELAASISCQNNKVLLIDADWLDTRADILLGFKKINKDNIKPIVANYLDTALNAVEKKQLSTNQLENLSQETIIDNLFLLAPSGRFEPFEKEQLKSFYDLLTVARSSYNYIIILVNSLVYDELSCISLSLSDLIIVAVDGQTDSIRAQGRTLNFLKFRQLIDAAKVNFVIFDYNSSLDLSRGIIKELCQNRILGFVTYNSMRRSRKNSSKPYASVISRKNKAEYKDILKKINIKIESR